MESLKGCWMIDFESKYDYEALNLIEEFVKTGVCTLDDVERLEDCVTGEQNFTCVHLSDCTEECWQELCDLLENNGVKLR